MKIREAVAADATTIAGLLEQLGHPLSTDEVLKKIELFSSDGFRLLVCEIEKGVAGFISLHWFDKFHSIGKTGRITALCVDEKFRGIGIGRSLVIAGENLLTTKGCREIEVTTNMRRQLTPDFYRKNGYTEQSRHFIKSLI
mgnify:CR=1 FL=1